MVLDDGPCTAFARSLSPSAERTVHTAAIMPPEQDSEALQAARERALEEESVQLDKEIEEEIRGRL